MPATVEPPVVAPSAAVPLAVRGVAAAWWPLAASWLFMGLELPLVSAAMARLKDPTVSLAAYGGVVFPLALLIEAPVIMLLGASTALCRDIAAYRVVRRYMYIAGGALTVLHALIAFTPLFDLLASVVLGVPDAIVEPSRLGFRILLPWTLSIAFRRTHQGVLIRFGGSHHVGIGTAIRLAINLLTIAVGFAIPTLPGIAVGAAAVAAGVVAEALYAGWAVHPVLRDRLRKVPPSASPLTGAGFWTYYLPLLIMPIILFLTMPMMSAAMSRMPEAIPSLAVWPVLSGMVFALRSLGFAFNEVVVAQLDAPAPVPALRRFALLLAAGVSSVLLIAALTPLGAAWFGRVSALAPPLVALGGVALWIAWPMPAISTYQSWYQGALLHGHRTAAITESVIAALVVTAIVLVAGIAWGRMPGLYVASAAMVIGGAVQTGWLALRARPLIRALERHA